MSKISSTTIIIVFIRFLIKISGLYLLIYQARPADQVIIYTILTLAVAEGYEFLAILRAKKNPQQKNAIYTIVTILNASIYILILFIANLYTPEFSLIGFLVVLASAIPGGLWTGIVGGLFTAFFYMLAIFIYHADPVLLERIPLFIIMSIISGVLSEQRVIAIKERDEAIEKGTRQKEVNRLKNEFIAIASHNLRTPITVIRGSVDMLLQAAQKIPDKEKTSLYENIKTNVIQLDHLTEDLLNISELENEENRLFTRQTDIVSIMEKVAGVMKIFAEQKNVQIEIIKPEKPIPPFQIDPDKIYKAISNLLSNAIKFSKENTQVTMSANREGSQVIVSIKDRGIGISPEEQKNLFQKFHRGTSILTYDYEGVGLGLYITKLIIEAHGGKIWLESTPGEGSTFYFSIPLATVEKLVENL